MLRRLARDRNAAVMVEFAISLPVLITLYIGGYVISDMIAADRKVTLSARALVDLVSHNISPSTTYNNPSAVTATAFVPQGGGTAQNFLSDAAIVLTPYNLTNATEQISLLRVCSTTQAYVVWTQAQQQTQTVAQASAGTFSAVSITSTTTPAPSTGGIALLTAGTEQGSLGASSQPTQTSGTTTGPVVSLPAGLIPAGSPLLPTGTNICANLKASQTPQVGSSGAYLFRGEIAYKYTPAVGLGASTATNMYDVVYMSPRLN